MSDQTTVVMSLSQRLADRQRRLLELETERTVLKQEIETLQDQLAAALPPPYGSTTRTQVLWLLRREPDRAYSPLDICRMQGKTRDADLNSVRLVLGRLLREGTVKRISHGRYQISKGA